MTAFPFQLVQRDEPAALMQACSQHLEQCLQQRLSEPSSRPLGLATGRTMEPLYGALVARGAPSRKGGPQGAMQVSAMSSGCFPEVGAR